MDFQENFMCPLCLQLAKDAVQSSCCTKIYCQSCIESALKKFSHCPCCRSQNMSYHPSRIARKVISEIKVPCQHCEALIETGDMSSHLAKCPKVMINCSMCKRAFMQADLPKHTAIDHQAEAKEYLIKRATGLLKTKSSRVEPPKPNLSNHNYFKPTINRIQRKSVLGTTSKYYCGGKLEGRCSCCNGYCGPDNGQNCDACMELDIKRWNLARTFLINPIGYISQVIRVQGNPKVSCFRVISFQKQGLFSKVQIPIACKPGSPCPPCGQLQNSILIGRYAGLY